MDATVPDLSAALTRHTALLVARSASLDPRAPSLCERWTRGHVLSHLARNADGIEALVRAAVDGTGESMYRSQAERDGDIEAGAGRDIGALVGDVAATAASLDVALARLGPEHASTPLERVPGIPFVPAGRITLMRLREVVVHHIDLDAGFGFGDVEPELLRLLVDHKVALLRGDDDTPDLTLSATEGDQWTLGLGTAQVGGSLAGLLAWLTRGHSDGVTADPLPHLTRIG